APNAPALFDEEGNVNWELDEYGNPTFDNPITGLANPNVNRMQSLQWNGNLSYRIVDGLVVKMNMGVNKLNQGEKQLVYKKNSNPLFMSSTNSTTSQILVERQYIVVEPQIHYEINFNKHRINSLIGSTFQKN